MLILQEQGKVTVSDLVCTHLPNCPTAWRAITVEHLLTHTAGLYDYIEISGGDPERYATAFGQRPSPEQLTQTFVNRPLEFPPGTKYQPNEQADTHDAVGYLDWTTLAPKAPDAVSFAGGAMYSTVPDLTRWNQFLLTGTPAIVKPDTLTQLLRPRVAAGHGVRYGYGIGAQGTGDATSHGHPGGVPGFSAYNEIRAANDLSIVVLSNLDTADAVRFARNLASLAGS